MSRSEYRRVTGPLRMALAAAGAIAALSLATPALAQRHGEQLWFQINTHVPIQDKVRVTLEQIARFSDRQQGLYQTEFGVLIGYRVADNVEIGTGYRKVGAHNGNNGGDEDRLRQQVVASFGPFSTRFRVDERFSVRGGGVGVRIRPLIRYNHKIGENGLALFLSHESFFMPNTTRWGQRSGYDRMRNIVGFAVPLGKNTVADIGYLNQFRFGRDGGESQMEHALSVQLTINLRDLQIFHVND